MSSHTPHVISPRNVGPKPPQASSDRDAIFRRAKKLLRKFGPLILVIFLLFAIKYFLLGIHLNVHHIKTSILEKCDQQIIASRKELDKKNEHWKQHKMVGRGAYGFIQWSSYRISASEIVAVGFGAVALRESRAASMCVWHGEDGKSIAGEPSLHYPLEKTDQFQYETIILKCVLTGKVSATQGGQVAVTLDKEQVVLYKEGEDDTVHEQLAPDAHRHKATFCTFPVAEAVDGERIRDWLDLHKFIGAEHVVAYDGGGFDKNDVAHVEKYVESGFLEITPMREIALYNIKSKGKVLAMHDCLYRSVLTSHWVVYLNWDDVLMMQSPRFLSILLEDHKELSWMTHGCRIYSTKLCLATSAVKGSGGGWGGTAGGTVPFPYERMVYRWPHYLCPDDYNGEKNKCPGDGGMQYIIANPSKVTLVRESEVVEPRDGGLMLSADDVRHDRFENVHKEGVSDNWCKEPHLPDEKVEWWVKDSEVAALSEEVRKILEGKKDGDEKPKR